MSRRRSKRRWRWLLVTVVVLVMGVIGWMWLRPVDSSIPVPGRRPAPREQITDAERERLHDIVEQRSSNPPR